MLFCYFGIKTKYKTRQCQGKNSFLHIHWMYKQGTSRLEKVSIGTFMRRPQFILETYVYIQK